MDHGIGHFEGMTQKEVDDIPREYLELTYAGGDKLFVPVDQADKLSKYVHEEGQEPILTRLGAVEWKRVAEKMRQETREMAKSSWISMPAGQKRAATPIRRTQKSSDSSRKNSPTRKRPASSKPSKTSRRIWKTPSHG